MNGRGCLYVAFLGCVCGYTLIPALLLIYVIMENRRK